MVHVVKGWDIWILNISMPTLVSAIVNCLFGWKIVYLVVNDIFCVVGKPLPFQNLL